MTTSVVLYEKNGEIVQVNDKFIYEDAIYKVFKEGIALWDTKYYSSDKPIKLKKKQFIMRCYLGHLAKQSLDKLYLSIANFMIKHMTG